MERWQCTQNDICDLIISETLRASYFVNSELKYRELVQREDGAIEAKEIDEERRFYFEGIYFIQVSGRVSPFDCIFGSFSSSRDMSIVANGELSGYFLLEENLSLSEVLKNGVVTMEELALVERRLSGRMNEESSPKEPSKKEKATYLNIIGAMLELLKNPRPGRIDDAAVIRELVANYGDKFGISESNLNRKLPEAKRSLNAD